MDLVSKYVILIIFSHVKFLYFALLFQKSIFSLDTFFLSIEKFAMKDKLDYSDVC